jgi:hypothetical protein
MQLALEGGAHRPPVILRRRLVGKQPDPRLASPMLEPEVAPDKLQVLDVPADVKDLRMKLNQL